MRSVSNVRPSIPSQWLVLLYDATTTMLMLSGIRTSWIIRVSMGFLRSVMLLVVIFFLAGCSSLIDSDQPHVVPDMVVNLKPGDTVGQTFVARHGGLNGISLWLEADNSARGQLILHLRVDPNVDSDIDKVSLSLEKLDVPGFYHFPLQIDDSSHNAYRYIFLELQGTGLVSVGAAPGETYIDGAAYFNHEPRDAQLAFQLSYDIGAIVSEIIRSFVYDGVMILILSILLYVVPGYAIILIFFRKKHSQISLREYNTNNEEICWPALLGLAIGISLSLYPFLIFWTSWFNLRLSALYGWLPIVGGVVIIGWHYRGLRFHSTIESIRQWVKSRNFWSDLAYIIVVFLICITRLLVIRTIDVPMWGDSYQHTMIAQLIVDNGGLFQSWKPYAELETFTYHFGFHSTVAVFHWIGGYEIPKATLLVGQLMNIFSVLSLYPLVIWSGGNRWSGVVAAMVAGLLSPMPIQYINWGRYTQLTGQVILPVAVVISGIFLQARHLKLSIAIVSSIVIAGLAFTHYRILIFYVIFTGVWIVLNVRKDNGLHQIKRLLIIGFGAASLFFMVLAYFLWLHYAKFYSKTNDRPRKGFRIYSPVQYD